MDNFGEHINLIWSIAELLRGSYKQSDYGKVILPFTVLRRLECVLEPTRQNVTAALATLPANADEAMRQFLLNMASGQNFHNTSPFTFANLLDAPDHLAANLTYFIQQFSEEAREIFITRFKLLEQIARLDKDNLLYLVVKRFSEADLHPDKVSNFAMGTIFEELIRRFSEQSNETAGEHFTPREVIRLMVNLLFEEDNDILTQKGIIRKLYDPACGTGGMLSVAEAYLRELNPDAHLEVYGQELNDESYATCKSDMMVKGQNAKNIYAGNSFTQDGLPYETFDYLLSNPPFGVEWKMVEKEIRKEAETLGFNGRFGAGLPRVSDGSLLFVQHMISKFNHNGDPSRLAVVLNGSPLFTGSAGSGESDIRRWIIENDWLEAIIALPTDMFYNTGIATYIWVITNQKRPGRRGQIQLINASDLHTPMRKSLGSKRKQMSEEQIATVTQIFGAFTPGPLCQIFANTDFGYRRITVERPLRLNFQTSPARLATLTAHPLFAKLKPADQAALLAGLATLDPATLYQDGAVLEQDLANCGLKLSAAQKKALLAGLGERDETAVACCNAAGQPEPDPDLRDAENVPLAEAVEAYFAREVLPHVPDAWIDHDKTKIGYEIPFNRHFYTYTPPRPLAAIDADLERVSAEIMRLLQEVKG